MTAKKGRQWTGQTAAVRGLIKTRLLELLISETRFVPTKLTSFEGPTTDATPSLISTLVRSAAGRFLAVLAEIELTAGTWPELHPWLWSLASSPSAAHREVALQSIFMLTDTLIITPAKPGGTIEGHVLGLLQLFARTLSDESLAVRVFTLRAVGKLAEYIEVGEDAEIAACQSLVPSIVAVLNQTLVESNDNAIKTSFEVLEGLSLAVRHFLAILY